MVARSHIPLPGDMYRLPSGRIVLVETVNGEWALCSYATSGAKLTLRTQFLIKQWRLA
jgi:hypothetical protein